MTVFTRFILLMLLCTCVNSWAQDSTFEMLLTDANSWHELTAVTNSEISSIEYDDAGALWLGYNNVVQHYDGITVTSYSVPTSSNWGYVQYLKWVGNAKLYVFFEHTIAILQDGQWTQIADNVGIISGDEAILDEHQRVWFITRNKLGLIDNDKVLLSDKIGTDIRGFLLDHQSQFWVADSANGTIKQLQYDATTPTAQVSVKRQWPGVLDPNKTGWSSYRLVQDKDNRIWSVSSGYYNPPVYADYHDLVATTHTANTRSWHQDEYFNGFTDRTHHDIKMTNNGELIIVGNHHLYKRDITDTWQRFPHPFGMEQSFSERYQLAITSRSAFLLKERFAVKRLNFVGASSTLYKDLIYACEDSINRYFLAKSGAVVRHNTSTSQWQRWDTRHGVISDPVAARCHNNKLYVFGGHNNLAAMNIFDGTTWQTQLYPALGRLIHFEKIIVQDDAIFVGGTAPNQPLRLLKLNAQGAKIASIVHPAQERLIAANNQEVMAVVNKAIYRNYANANIEKPWATIPQDMGWVSDLIVDHNQNVWLSSWDSGLFLLTQNQWSKVNDLNGLSTKHIANLMLDKNHNLHALTNQGLYRKYGAQWINKPLPNIRVERQNNQLIEGAKESLWVNHAGRDWYLRRHGYINRTVSFLSLNYQNNKLAPETYVKLIGEINPGAQAINLHFSGTDYWNETPDQKLQFSYRINQSQWRPFSHTLYHTISDLTAGTDYLIEVRAIDQDGNIDSSPATLSFVIDAVFWQSRWFKLLAIAAIVLIFMLSFMLYIQRLRHINLHEQSKLRFLTHITHELRSPLSLIVSPLEVLNAKLLDTQLQQQAQFALKNSKRLASLIEQVLDYRQLQSHDVQFETQQTDLISFAYTVCCDLSAVAQEKQQKIIFISNRNSLVCHLNQEALNKIIDNLVINALKYSAPGATVIVVLLVNANLNVQLLVKDQGEGMTSAEQVATLAPRPPKKYDNKLLNWSTKTQSNQTQINTSFKSYGIGLALVKELVDKLGGSIEVFSPVTALQFEQKINSLAPEIKLNHTLPTHDAINTGPGSLFHIKLQFDNLLAEEQGIFEQECHSVIDVFHAEEMNKNNKKSRSLSQTKPKLLIVDDNDVLSDFLIDNLNDLFLVSRAKNGLAGFEYAVNHLPDIILSDIYMPQLNGIHMAKKLQSNVLTSHIPIILMTSADNIQLEINAFIAGAIDYLNKPISVQQLKLKLQSLLVQQQKLIEKCKNKADIDTTHRPKFIQKVDTLLRQNLADEHFTINELAQALAMSRSAFYRKFNQEMAVSPAEYITQFKLQHAQILLQSHTPVADVAAQVGYADSSAFGRLFKKHLSLSPTAYKQSWRG